MFEKVFVPEEKSLMSFYANWYTLRCPNCGEYNLHPFGYQKFDGEDYYKAPWPERGDLYVLSFWCEMCPATTRLEIGFHKGSCFSQIVVDKEGKDSPQE